MYEGRYVCMCVLYIYVWIAICLHTIVYDRATYQLVNCMIWKISYALVEGRSLSRSHKGLLVALVVPDGKVKQNRS